MVEQPQETLAWLTNTETRESLIRDFAFKSRETASSVSTHSDLALASSWWSWTSVWVYFTDVSILWRSRTGDMLCRSSHHLVEKWRARIWTPKYKVISEARRGWWPAPRCLVEGSHRYMSLDRRMKSGTLKAATHWSLRFVMFFLPMKFCLSVRSKCVHLRTQHRFLLDLAAVAWWVLCFVS